jgi:hypothetical protein
MVVVYAHAAEVFTKDARSFSLFIKHLKQPETPKTVDGSGVLHVVERGRE